MLEHQIPQTPVKVIVHSFDFDGMITSHQFFQKIEEILQRPSEKLTKEDFKILVKELIAVEPYKKFFDDRFLEKNQQHLHCLMVGSNRQTIAKDLLNSYKTNAKTLSCYLFFEALSEVLKETYQSKIELEKLLFQDIIKNKPYGSTFDLAVSHFLEINKTTYLDKNKFNIIEALEKKIGEEARDTLGILDEEKILLIYTQMHHINNKYREKIKNCVLEFDYVDDRQDILSALAAAFNNACILPGTLHLEQFACDPDYANEMRQKGQIFEKTMISTFNLQYDPNPFNTYQLLVKAFFNENDGDIKLTRDSINSSHQNNVIHNYTHFIAEVNHSLLIQQLPKIMKMINLTIGGMDLKSQGIKEINKVMKEYHENKPDEMTPELILTYFNKIYEIARNRLEKLHVGSGIFQFKRSSEQQKFYEAIKNLKLRPTQSLEGEEMSAERKFIP